MAQHHGRSGAAWQLPPACDGLVVWQAGQVGYSVEVYRHGEMIARHICGNHAYDPERSVPLDSPEALSPALLHALARKLALEMAQAFAIPAENVRGAN
ncbi:MAG: hypothetical protein JO041_10870 [Acidobacteria bacterium]|nr:hypothetical protein [Acidobacteriota bacterium]